MPPSLASLALTGVGTVVLLVVVRGWKKASQHPPPPGPVGYPLIGNLLDTLDTSNAFGDYKSAAESRRSWGDITSASVLGTTIVTLHTYEKAIEMLERKGQIYSSRPVVKTLVMGGWDNLVSLLPYGSQLRECRRMIRQDINPSKITDFYAIQESSTRSLIHYLEKTPEKFYERISWHTGSMLLKIVYGYDTTQELNDPVIATILQGLSHVEKLTTPSLLQVFPWLQYVPTWVPFVNYKQTMATVREDYKNMRDTPFEHALNNRENGEENFVTKWVKRTQDGEKKLPILKESALIVFAAGVDTSEISIEFFLFRMQENPDIVKKAQAELDAVVGRNKMPTFADRENLPYINALCKEVLRHDPPLPAGIPHTSTADDVHDGYFLPAGSVIIPSIWEMSRDPDVYRNPEEFNPSRFLGPDAERDPASFVFGFGRRICCGALLADGTLFIAVAMILAAFDISPPADKSQAKLEVTNGAIRHPLPYKCSITPRAGVNVQELIST